MRDELIFEPLEDFFYQNQLLTAEVCRISNLYKGITSFLIRLPKNNPLKALSQEAIFAVHTSNPLLDWSYKPGEKSLQGNFTEEQEILHRLLTEAIRKHFYQL